MNLSIFASFTHSWENLKIKKEVKMEEKEEKIWTAKQKL
jgi:hypothetical protein